MADIGAIGGFNPATTRSNADSEAAAQRRADEARQAAEERQAEQAELAQEEAAAAEESDSEDQSQTGGQQQLSEDTVTLSSAAQDFLLQSDRDAAETAANDDAAVEATTSVAAPAVDPTQIGGVNGTNQTTTDEENTSAVNGNQDNQSEQTRALGQLVDQFA